MPRLSPRLVREISNDNALLGRLLIATRDVAEARHELRWLREHAIRRANSATSEGPYLGPSAQQQLKSFCHSRARGVPLQYLLGTEFFGALEIRCRPGVLIPRQETASLTSFLARVLSKAAAPSSATHHAGRPLQILDLCTGTGCIPLLLQHDLQESGFTSHTPVHLLGIDISVQALELAQANLATNPSIFTRSPGSHILFSHGNVLNSVQTSARGMLSAHTDTDQSTDRGWDVIVSNPPYISPRSLLRMTTKSVRLHEPRSALVPIPPADHALSVTTPEMPDSTMSHNESLLDVEDERTADLFYPAILRTALRSGAQVVLVEVGDDDQARRVAMLALRMLGEGGPTNTAALCTNEQSVGKAGTDTSGQGSRMRLAMAVEIWRDEPTLATDPGHILVLDKEITGVRVRGRGAMRGVFVWRRQRGVELQRLEYEAILE